MLFIEWFNTQISQILELLIVLNMLKTSILKIWDIEKFGYKEKKKNNFYFFLIQYHQSSKRLEKSENSSFQFLKTSKIIFVKILENENHQ